MKSLSEIIANAIDLAGGTNPLVDIQVNAATLYALNVLADLELENSSSARGQTAQKFRKRFVPHSRSGSIDRLPSYIRLRTNFGSWEIVDIVSDIEDLTQAERENRRAILFYGVGDAYKYELSFDADSNFECEMWGTAFGADAETLDQTGNIPEEFGHLAATRLALVLLDDLLLQDNAARLTGFVQSRKQSLYARLKDLQHRWTVYRSNAVNDQADNVIRNYDPFADGEYGTVFEN